MIRKILLALLLLAPLGLYPFLRDTKAKDDPPPPPERLAPPLNADQRQALACLAITPFQAFPAGIPWEPMRGVGQSQSEVLEEMAKTRPLEFLQFCLNRYESEIHGYRCIFLKQEKVNGVMRPKEKLRVHFREKPFSVHMEWLEGKDKAFRTMYVEGEHDGLLLVRVLFAFGPLMHKKVDADDVKATSRFPITQFGMNIGAKETLHFMRKAEERKALHLSYEGIERLEKTGNRACFKFVRAPYNPPEADNVCELIVYIDRETLLQVGSILKDADGKLIAEYFFRDIELNPTFDAKQFTLKGI